MPKSDVFSCKSAEGDAILAASRHFPRYRMLLMNYYFHIPFCRSKCGYCAFYSEPSPEPGMFDAYLDKLERELDAAPLPPPDTVYLGGGTPTLFDPARLERLFRLIRQKLAPKAGTEISIEANPETLDRGKIRLIRGFANRISLGVQSFSAEHRRTLGRDCTQRALQYAIDLIREAKFPEWNIDLIYAIPGATRRDFFNDLATAARAGAPHISCYSLTPEEGARLCDRLQPDEEEAATLWEAIPQQLAPWEFRRYEISNYALPGHECRHNVNVWRGGLLRGFGPAAASFDGALRYTQAASLTEWLAGAPPELDEIPGAARLNEIFAVNLRTASGWTPHLWSRVPGADGWEARLRLARSAAKETSPEFFDISPGRITLSSSGLLFWNTIAEVLL